MSQSGSGGIAVNYEEMQNLRTKLVNASGQLDQAIGIAQTAVNSVAGASWQGESSKAFADLHAQWSQSAKSIHDALAGMADFLQKSALPGFQQTDQQLAQGLGGQH